jgi:hypothetical protein
VSIKKKETTDCVQKDRWCEDIEKKETKTDGAGIENKETTKRRRKMSGL